MTRKLQRRGVPPMNPGELLREETWKNGAPYRNSIEASRMVRCGPRSQSNPT
jgi:hypothetical protein